MRTSSSILLSLLFLSSTDSQAAPTASEQTRYDGQVQVLVNRINSHRGGLGRASLQPLNPLCQAAREQAEFELLGTGAGISVFNRATAAGYAGNYIALSSSMASFGTISPAALLENLLSHPTFGPAIASVEGESLGVGLALRADRSNTLYRLEILIGKPFVPGNLGGTNGNATGSGRGLLDPILLPSMLAGAHTGNSIDGYVFNPNIVVITPQVQRAFNSSLRQLVRRSSNLRGAEGRPVKFKLPLVILGLMKTIKISGQLPPGVRFNPRTGGFTGKANQDGTFTVTLTGTLDASINGSNKLRPITLTFNIKS